MTEIAVESIVFGVVEVNNDSFTCVSPSSDPTGKGGD